MNNPPQPWMGETQYQRWLDEPAAGENMQRNRWQRFLHRGACGPACPEHGWMASMTNRELLGYLHDIGHDVPADSLPAVQFTIDEE